VTLTIDELTVADAAAAWSALGFEVEDGVCVLGEVRLRLAGAEGGGGLVGWSLRGLAAGALAGGDLDGLATAASERPPPGTAPAHPNGITAIDHVVAISPDLDRTVAVLRGAGLDLRRIREQPTPAGAPRQAFFRLGQTILEVVQEPEEATARAGGQRPAFFWGLALLAPDLEATVAGLGERVSETRAAVQPGRRIATLRRAAGLALPVALISPAAGAGHAGPS
jgi:catechol 2,3-dioxygenase-like lactoylglutathione lyase family enzyme